MTAGIPNRFEDMWIGVKIGGLNECWEWQRYVHPSGYAYFRVNHHNWAVHQIAAKLSGIIVSRINPHVLHTCDNRKCCNPKHLYVGNHNRNMQDKVDRGRAPRGEKHGMAKLSDKQVEQIRKDYLKGGKIKEFAEKFGVTKQRIGQIIADLPVQRLGERHGHAKLSDEQVEEIRELWKLGDRRQIDIANIYGVNRALISYIVNGKHRK